MKKENLYCKDSGGVYCFFPFERFDHKDNRVFKIGNTEQSFQKRLGNYHTYFVGTYQGTKISLSWLNSYWFDTEDQKVKTFVRLICKNGFSFQGGIYLLYQ